MDLLLRLAELKKKEEELKMAISMELSGEKRADMYAQDSNKENKVWKAYFDWCTLKGYKFDSDQTPRERLQEYFDDHA